MADRKKRRGDRKDGYLVRETDPLHAISPYILPNRTDNEAVLTETVDMTNVVAYIEGRNADSPEFRYTFFHFICAALAKTITLRPKMNSFIPDTGFTTGRIFCSPSSSRENLQMTAQRHLQPSKLTVKAMSRLLTRYTNRLKNTFTVSGKATKTIRLQIR